MLPALHCFRARMGGTLRLDHDKLVDKIPHGLYNELGWQVSFQQLETLLQKYYPRDPALGGNSPQTKDPPNSDQHELMPLHSFEKLGSPPPEAPQRSGTGSLA